MSKCVEGTSTPKLLVFNITLLYVKSLNMDMTFKSAVPLSLSWKLPLALLGRVRCSPPHIALGDFVISAFSQAPVFLLNVSSSEPGLDTVVSIVVSLSTVPSHV